jgi:hypothetical protein
MGLEKWFGKFVILLCKISISDFFGARFSASDFFSHSLLLERLYLQEGNLFVVNTVTLKLMIRVGQFCKVSTPVFTHESVNRPQYIAFKV